MLTHQVLRAFEGDEGSLAPGTLVDGDSMLNRESLESEQFLRRLTPAEAAKAAKAKGAADPEPEDPEPDEPDEPELASAGTGRGKKGVRRGR